MAEFTVFNVLDHTSIGNFARHSRVGCGSEKKKRFLEK